MKRSRDSHRERETDTERQRDQGRDSERESGERLRELNCVSCAVISGKRERETDRQTDSTNYKAVV